MDIIIFDVEHGFCALVKDDSRRKILIECGHNTFTGFKPTDYLLDNNIKSIDKLWISNFDEDHISNLADLLKNIQIKTFSFNESIDTDTLYEWKERNGITDNMDVLIDIIEDTEDINMVSSSKNYEEYIYYNKYPIFTDTNNLSAVFFLL